MCEPRCLKEPRSEIVECFILNVLVLGLVSLLCSCAAPIAIVIPVIVDTFTLEAPFDEVWQATVATIAEKSLPIEAIEKESGILTTKQVLFASGSLAENAIDRVAVKPSISFGIWSSGRYSLSVFIRSVSEGRTSVKITTHFEAFEANMTKSWHVCYSKGIVESSTWESIKSKVPVQMPDGTKLRIF